MQKSKLQAKIKEYPDFKEERKCWRRGYRIVVGLDEVGRGPLAGPVCAAAVCFCAQKQIAAAKLKSKNEKLKIFEGIRDSKQLTAKQREAWYKILTRHPDIKWGIGIISEKVIDKINIFEATKLAMKKAVKSLSGKSPMANHEIQFIILDGNFTIEDLSINQKAIVKADEKVFSCAAASVIAKVTRDRIMLRYAKKYPQYGFERHRGYGTRLHFEALKKYGFCKIHRKSFKPIANLAKLKFI